MDVSDTRHCWTDLVRYVLREQARSYRALQQSAQVESPCPFPTHVRLVEVGPRDGLQNEAQPISVADKVRLVDALTAAGLGYIEVGSFVSPKWVPQMAGSAEVFAQIQRKPGVTYGALAPNLRGFEDALACGVKEVAVFAAASRSVFPAQHQLLDQRKPGALRAHHGCRQTAWRQRARLRVLRAGLPL